MEALAIVELTFSVIEKRSIFFIFIAGSKSHISWLSPDLEIAKIESFFSTIPRSPCNASAGWIKKAGVPVLESVAANLLAICPDFPTPVIIIFPLQFEIFVHNSSTLKIFDL